MLQQRRQVEYTEGRMKVAFKDTPECNEMTRRCRAETECFPVFESRRSRGHRVTLPSTL